MPGAGPRGSLDPLREGPARPHAGNGVKTGKPYLVQRRREESLVGSKSRRKRVGRDPEEEAGGETVANLTRRPRWKRTGTFLSLVGWGRFTVLVPRGCRN